MKNPALTVVAAVIALTATGLASASTASANFSDFHIELIDLDPSDGIAPAVQFEDVQGGSFVAAESGTPADHLTDLHLGGQVFGGANSSATHDAASASAQLNGDAFASGAQAAATASADLRDTYGAASVWLGDGSNVVTFTLTPHTRLVISGDATASVMSTIDDPNADAWASIYLKLTDYTGLDQVSDGGAEAEQFSTDGARPSELVDSRSVEISFDNATADSAGGIFYGAIDVSVSDLSLSVPEPATGALLLSGLGLAGLLRRRRR